MIALAANTFYFALAAGATIYSVAEAWHYGFFLTPFPAILTGIALLFVGASAVGLYYLHKGRQRALSLLGLMAFWTCCAAQGSYFCSASSVCSTLSYFIPIVAIVTLGLIACFSGGRASDPGCVAGGRFSQLARWLAVAAPIPIIAYTCLSLYANSHTDGSRPNIDANIAFVQTQRFLFGVKRADALLVSRMETECQHGHYQLAEEYAKLAVQNAQQVPLFCSDKEDLRLRLEHRWQDLLWIQGVQGR